VTASPQKTRLFAQGVQVSVQPEAGKGEPVEPTAAMFVRDISTQSMARYIDHNLSEAPPSPEEATLAEETVGQATGVYVARPWPIRLLRRASRSAAARRVAPLALSSLATLIVCWFLWGRAPRTAPASGSHSALPPFLAAVPPLPPLPAPALAVALPRPRPAPAVAVAPVAPVALPNDTRCSARISSRPAGAAVMVGDRYLGSTPLDAGDLPCGPTPVTLTHARYRPASAVVDAQDGQARPLFVRMTRPEARLVLRSTPPRATFKVNRSVVGSAPREATVMRFETIRIEATLPGHRPWRRVIYMAAPRLEIDANFTSPSGAKGAPRRTAR
jgi:hypothetical protein